MSAQEARRRAKTGDLAEVVRDRGQGRTRHGAGCALGATTTEVLYEASCVRRGDRAFDRCLLAPGSPSHAASVDPTGYWYKPDAVRKSKIQVFKCGKGKSQLCAKIAWLKDPNDSKGSRCTTFATRTPRCAAGPSWASTIFTGLAPSAPGTWTGKIYNPEDGHTYSATLTVVSRKEIKLSGCKAWLLCGEKQWLRTSALRLT